jgi:hypothetical protein
MPMEICLINPQRLLELNVPTLKCTVTLNLPVQYSNGSFPNYSETYDTRYEYE